MLSSSHWSEQVTGTEYTQCEASRVETIDQWPECGEQVVAGPGHSTQEVGTSGEWSHGAAAGGCYLGDIPTTTHHSLHHAARHLIRQHQAAPRLDTGTHCQQKDLGRPFLVNAMFRSMICKAEPWRLETLLDNWCDCVNVAKATFPPIVGYVIQSIV